MLLSEVHSFIQFFLVLFLFFNFESHSLKHRNIYLFLCCCCCSFFPFFSMCALVGLSFIAENGVRMYDSFHSFAVTMRHLRLSFRRSVPINKIFDGIRNTVHARTLARTHTRPQADHKTGKNTIWTYVASTSSPSPSYTFHHFYAFRPKQTNERATKIIFVWIFPEDDRIREWKKDSFFCVWISVSRATNACAKVLFPLCNRHCRTSNFMCVCALCVEVKKCDFYLFFLHFLVPPAMALAIYRQRESWKHMTFVRNASFMKFPALNRERAGVPNLSNNKNCDKFISGGLLFASLAGPGSAGRSTRDARCCKCTRPTKSTRHTYCWINKCNDRKKNTEKKKWRENYTHFYVVLCALCVFCAKSHRLKPKQINAFPSSS